MTQINGTKTFAVFQTPEAPRWENTMSSSKAFPNNVALS